MTPTTTPLTSRPTRQRLLELAKFCESAGEKFNPADPATLDDLYYALDALRISQAAILRELAALRDPPGR